MADNTWVLDREQTIYSKTKALVLSRLRKKYPDITVTQDSRVLTDPKFPNVFIKFLQPIEQGQDLVGDAINAVLLTVQIEVTVTQEQGMMVANEVSWVLLDVYKSMGFGASMPYFDTSTTKTYRTISRFTRIIGYNDII